MKKLIHCDCGFKFEVSAGSKTTMCFECQRLKKPTGKKFKKELDVAFEKLDLFIKKKGLK